MAEPIVPPRDGHRGGQGGVGEIRDRVRRRPRPTRHGAAFRGYSWGSAVHGALAAAADDDSEVTLRAACRALLVEHGRPLDDHGEPREVEELLALVRSVRASELWRRAAERRARARRGALRGARGHASSRAAVPSTGRARAATSAAPAAAARSLRQERRKPTCVDAPARSHGCGGRTGRRGRGRRVPARARRASSTSPSGSRRGG